MSGRLLPYIHDANKYQGNLTLEGFKTKKN